MITMYRIALLENLSTQCSGGSTCETETFDYGKRGVCRV